MLKKKERKAPKRPLPQWQLPPLKFPVAQFLPTCSVSDTWEQKQFVADMSTPLAYSVL